MNEFKPIPIIFLLTMLVCAQISFKDSNLHADCVGKYDPELKQYVYSKVTIQPEFPGGTSNWARFLNKQFTFPSTIGDNDMATTTVASFIVLPNGALTKIGIRYKTPAQWSALDSAFVQTLKRSVNWIPGSCNGKKVAATVLQPMTIHLEIEE